MRVQSDSSQIGLCGCGRAPNGKCNGWHGLSEKAYLMELQLWQEDANNSNLKCTDSSDHKNPE